MSSEFTVNLSEYLSDTQMQQIAEEEFRRACALRSDKDFERILSNAAYRLVEAAVDASFDGGMAQTVKRNAINIISDLSSYSVFRAPNAWDREASKGWEHLQKAVDESSDLIRQRVQDIVRDYDSGDLRSLLEDRLIDVLIDKLKA